ncbi:hypothetical protein LHJ74_05715 [Streptomyces sp. N2-109]|uniref:CchlP n=1 Tax=Streptomyces gossypii TaxID=2883101 RepID=A0ABT2JNI5_9ACTN|nr:hypothetical protein [Streptomyces gossypii]MCT2589432.1 hypothetical protein [Streptomyces gossypii]
MEPELVTLTTTAATTLVGLMVTDSWNRARERVVAFLARGDDARTPAVEEDLEVVRVELTEAVDSGEEPVLADAEAGWRTRLRRVLAADPEAAAELRALLDELAPLAAGSEGRGTVHNVIGGGTQESVIQGRDFSHLTIHTHGRPGTPGTPGRP